jgi:alkanesulfonate monooxygenase SsuD/methylene tetrahydromethanopterin reductase-like flavin-dependent oxidoreductase (luciferase family)
MLASAVLHRLFKRLEWLYLLEATHPAGDFIALRTVPPDPQPTIEQILTGSRAMRARMARRGAGYLAGYWSCRAKNSVHSSSVSVRPLSRIAASSRK